MHSLVSHWSDSDFKQRSLLVADIFSFSEPFEVLEECSVEFTRLQDSLSCFHCISFGTQHLEKKKGKSQGACVRL